MISHYSYFITLKEYCLQYHKLTKSCLDFIEFVVFCFNKTKKKEKGVLRNNTIPCLVMSFALPENLITAKTSE